MRKAGLDDKNIVVDILTKSVKNDPQIDFLLGKSRDRNKVRMIMEYLFDVSFNKGEIYLNDDNTATALWNISDKERFTVKSALRSISLIFKMGFESAWKIMKMDRLVAKYYPKNRKYARLWTIGVLPESKGKGYVKQFINLMADKMSKTKSALFIETANVKNIGTYNKIGFHVFKAIKQDEHLLFCMSKTD